MQTVSQMQYTCVFVLLRVCFFGEQMIIPDNQAESKILKFYIIKERSGTISSWPLTPTVTKTFSGYMFTMQLKLLIPALWRLRRSLWSPALRPVNVWQTIGVVQLLLRLVITLSKQHHRVSAALVRWVQHWLHIRPIALLNLAWPPDSDQSGRGRDGERKKDEAMVRGWMEINRERSAARSLLD